MHNGRHKVPTLPRHECPHFSLALFKWCHLRILLHPPFSAGASKPCRFRTGGRSFKHLQTPFSVKASGKSNKEFTVKPNRNKLCAEQQPRPPSIADCGMMQKARMPLEAVVIIWHPCAGAWGPGRGKRNPATFKVLGCVRKRKDLPAGLGEGAPCLAQETIDFHSVQQKEEIDRNRIEDQIKSV